MRIRVIFFALIMLLITPWAASFADEVAIVHNREIMRHVQLLPHTGVLMQDERRFVYLKIDDQYLYDLFPLIKDEGFILPAFFRDCEGIGAHIAVMDAAETKGLPKITELGQSFPFTPKCLVKVQVGRKIYLVLQVDSPELKRLRKKYGLRCLPKGHQFHITLAVKDLDNPPPFGVPQTPHPSPECNSCEAQHVFDHKKVCNLRTEIIPVMPNCYGPTLPLIRRQPPCGHYYE